MIAFLVSQQLLQAQITNPGDAAQQGATDHVNNNISGGVNNGLNKTESAIKGLFKKKNKPANTAQASQPATASGTTNPGTASSSNTSAGSGASSGPGALPLKVYANYDFVPGDKVIFEDNFTDERDGEFPAQWELEKGQGILNKLGGLESFYLTDGNYARVNPLVRSKSYLGNLFTIEYDTYNPDNGAYGLITFLKDAGGEDLVKMQISTGEASCEYPEGKSNSGSLPAEIQYDNFKDRWHHVALVYNNKQLKVYVDQFRVLYIPNCNAAPANVGFGGIGDPDKPIIFKNVRIASGGNSYMVSHKFTDAKIITHGINFDIDKSTLRPESMGTLNMIVQILKDNPGLTFEVDGHTDNSGNAAHNLLLSQQRADAVKTQLVGMGVEASRLTTKGFGDTKPLADNGTPAGKANNRRVEFVRI